MLPTDLGERENGMARYTLSLVTPCCLCVGRAGERGGALYPLSRHSLLPLGWESERTKYMRLNMIYKCAKFHNDIFPTF